VPTQLINLTFHGVGRHERTLEEGEDTVWVTEERFLSVLDGVAGRPDVQISFDDGNASDVAVALPALRERGLTATFFVVAGRIGVPEFLSATDLRTLDEAGMRIGNHGMRHRPWRGADLNDELVVAKQMLEDALGRPITDAACPFGSYDRRVLRALHRTGYARVYTSDRGPARSDHWLQARTTIRQDDALAPILAPPVTSLRRRAQLAVKRWR